MPVMAGKFNSAKGSRNPSHAEEKQWYPILDEIRSNVLIQDTPHSK
jgi:hypothetical protein